MTDNSTNTLYLVVILVGVLLLIGLAGFLARRRPGRLNLRHFNERWQVVQELCSKPETWPLAIINADKLLDEALKKSHFKGKTMGERMVAAQRNFSDNDGVWFGHKLRNKLVHEEVPSLRQRDVMRVLKSFRQGLKDLGAFK